MSAAGLVGDQYTDWKQKGGWFRSDRSGVDHSPIDAAFNDSLNGAIRGIAESFKKLGLQIGVGAHILDDFTATFKVELFKLSDADMQKAIDAGLKGVADQMAFAFVDKMRDGSIAAMSNIASALPDVIALADAYRAKHAGEKNAEGKFADYVGQLFAAAQALGALTKIVGGSLSLSDIAGLQASGETLLQTFQRISDTFSITNQVATMLGKGADAFGKVGIASLDARTELIDLAGGLQNLAAMSNAFYTTYYSAEEQAAAKFKAETNLVASTFKDLGISIPTTDAEFRKLVEGIDLSTAAGRQLLVTLLQIAPAFHDIRTKAPTVGFEGAATLLGPLMDDQNNSVLAAYNRQRNSLQDLVNISNRSSTGFAALVAGMQDMRTATGQLLLQIQQVKYSLGSMFGDTVRTLRMQTMSPQEQYNWYMNDAEEARSASLKATDPLLIKQYASRVNSDVLSANGF